MFFRKPAKKFFNDSSSVIAPMRARWYDRTPLHSAAVRGHTEVVELLLAEGAEVNARMSKGYTALQLAEQEGHARVAELLRKHEKRK